MKVTEAEAEKESDAGDGLPAPSLHLSLFFVTITRDLNPEGTEAEIHRGNRREKCTEGQGTGQSCGQSGGDGGAGGFVREISAGRPVKRPAGFPVPEVFEPPPASEFGGDLFGEDPRLGPVEKPVRAYSFPERESLTVDPDNPCRSQAVGLRDIDRVTFDGFF